jgi:hypothetical protein
VKLLSTRARAELWKLQAVLHKVADERNGLLKVLLDSPGVLTPGAQRELWLEFSWLDQEYRFCVAQLVAFCEKHGSKVQPADETRPISEP